MNGRGCDSKGIHLAIDAVGAKHSGGAVVLSDIVRAAIRDSEVKRITVFCSPRRLLQFDFPNSDRLVLAEQAAADSSTFGRLLWLASGLGREVLRRNADLLLCMSGMGWCSTRTALFFQQSLVFCDEALRLCDVRTRLRIRAMARLMKSSSRLAALVIAQTPTMADLIQRHCNVPRSKIILAEPWGDTVGMDSRDSGHVAAMLNAPEGFRLLYVGNTEPYKNVKCIIEGFAIVRRRFPQAGLFLTCSPEHPFCRNDGVWGLGSLSGSPLRQAYTLATGFVTASLSESGNLTLAEALMMGTPVLTADRGYARDLCGDCCIYFDPLNPSTLSQAMIKLLENRQLREEMAQRGILRAATARAMRPYDRMVGRLVAVAGNPAG